MSSAFTVAEEGLSHLGLAAVDGDDLEVLVGGLGMGYTAVAALAVARVCTTTSLRSSGATNSAYNAQ
jgi:hypothetical protein